MNSFYPFHFVSICLLYPKIVCSKSVGLLAIMTIFSQALVGLESNIYIYACIRYT